MPESAEFETGELQEKIQELNEEREEDRARATWIRYVGLTTAVLAVVAAVAALQSGTLVNEALIHQIKASDTWNEYQASREKSHLYTLALNGLVDANPKSVSEAGRPPTEEELKTASSSSSAPTFVVKPANLRAREYRIKIDAELEKQADRSKEAKALENDAELELHHHHFFEYAVTLIQVAIALGAIAAIVAVKPVWYLSMVAGAIGIVLFAIGFM